MKFIQVSPCYCNRGEKIESCCLDFDSLINFKTQVKLRQKYSDLPKDFQYLKQGRNFQKDFILEDYTPFEVVKEIFQNYYQIYT